MFHVASHPGSQTEGADPMQNMHIFKAKGKGKNMNQTEQSYLKLLFRHGEWFTL